MNDATECDFTPATIPGAEFDAAGWIREWSACLCSVHLIDGGISLYQRQFFREPDFEQLAEDHAFSPHLRLYGREELSGARKMLQRLLFGNPRALGAIARHLIAETGDAA